MSNYTKGRAFEYQVKKNYEAHKTWKVIRASGSHGEFDLIAYSPNRKPVFIQCKVCKTQAEADRLKARFKAAFTPCDTYVQSLMIKIGSIRRVQTEIL